MSTFERRLKLIEQHLASLPAVSDAARAQACTDLCDVLWSRYPDEPWRLPGGDQVPALRRTTAVQVAELAVRLQSRSATEDDLITLQSLPDAPLRVFGRTAEEFVILVGTVTEKY